MDLFKVIPYTLCIGWAGTLAHINIDVDSVGDISLLILKKFICSIVGYYRLLRFNGHDPHAFPSMIWYMGT